MMADRDWPLGSGAIAAFVILVAAVLGAVRGWRAPFLAWLAIAGCVLGALALHAAARALAAAWRRHWRAAAGAGLLGAAFAAAVALLPALGLRAASGEGANPFGDVLASGAARPARSAP